MKYVTYQVKINVIFIYKALLSCTCGLSDVRLLGLNSASGRFDVNKVDVCDF